MLLRTDTSPRRGKAARLLTGAVGLGLLLLLIGWALLDDTEPVAEAAPPVGTYHCDMEQVDGDDFVGTHGRRFAKGGYQSDQRARSGRFSCLVPRTDATEYALNTTLENVRPGDLYRVSVWVYQEVNVTTTLVLSDADDGSRFYHATREFVDRADGWQQYRLEVVVPYRDSPRNLLVYVYSNGARDAYFDDLEIARIDHFAESTFQPERINIEVDEAAMAKFEAQRAAAIRLGILVNDEDSWVKATVAGQAAKIRLKGDWLDHLKGDKWSFRVRLKDANTWRGLVTFSLQTPKARWYLHEYLLHELWRAEGVLAPRYDFVELVLNGKSLGVYAYEEHFEKQLVEAQQRREGPIVRFGEGPYWGTHRQQLEGLGTIAYDVYYPERTITAAPIEPFRESKLVASPTLSAQFNRAHALMEQFRRGLSPVAELFDLPRLANYYAVADVMAAYHGIVWHNQRFYYNPVIDRLEPIGFDGYGGPPAERNVFLAEGYTNPAQLNSGRLYQSLFLDTAFVAEYTRALYRISDPAYLRAFLDERRDEWLPRATFLGIEFPEYRFNPSQLVENAQFLRSKLFPLGANSLRAYAQKSGTSQTVRVANLHTLPVRLVGYRYAKNGPVTYLDDPLVLPAATPRNLLLDLRRDTSGALTVLEELPRKANSALRLQRTLDYTKLDLPANATQLIFSALGIDTSFSAPILNWDAPELLPTTSQRLTFSVPVDTQFYRLRQHDIVFPAGRQTIDRDLLIPAGYRVSFEAGAQLDFIEGSAFISRSPVMAYGNADQPVLIESSDGSAAGFTVLQAPETSRLTHTRFSGFNTLQRGDWRLTGAVTFYESDVELRRVVVANNHCEDALNVVRSAVDIDGLLVADTPSDGFDCDFCTGEVRAARFERTGNDGMDVSGSVLTVHDARFVDNGDKGLSVGEDSDLILLNGYVRNALIGMAAKDLSTLAVETARLEACDQGFVAYQKKPEYGPATVLVKTYTAERVRRLTEAGPGSVVELGSEVVR